MHKIISKILSAAIFIGGTFFTTAHANPIKTPEGNMPRVQWATVESTTGNLEKISEIGARVLSKTSAGEAGTYALYGVVEKDNHDLMRLLEIYESNEAYRIHSTSEAFQQYRAERFPYLKNLEIVPVNAIVLEQKIDGVGKCVTTHTYNVNPADLAKFQNLISAEYRRAVKEDDGVLGMFVTAETANPNVIRTMEIFADESARENYIKSAAHKNLTRQIESMFATKIEVAYLPANISLTKKGVVK